MAYQASGIYKARFFLQILTHKSHQDQLRSRTSLLDHNMNWRPYLPFIPNPGSHIQ